MRGIVDNDGVDGRADDVSATGPFNNIRYTGLDTGDGTLGGEVQRQRTVLERCAAERADVGTGQVAGSYLRGRHVERQAQRVPCAVLVERAAIEHDIRKVPIGDIGAIVATFIQRARFRMHIELPAILDAMVVVCLREAIVVYDRRIDIGGTGVEGIDTPAAFLYIAKGLGIVGIRIKRSAFYAGEGAAVRHIQGILALGDGGRSIETVKPVGADLFPTGNASAGMGEVCSGAADDAVEHTTAYTAVSRSALNDAHHAAVRAVAADGADDGDAADAALQCSALHVRNDTGSHFIVSGDGAGHAQVLDGGAKGSEERCTALLLQIPVFQIDGQRTAVTEEGATEENVAPARHRSDGRSGVVEIVGQLEELFIVVFAAVHRRSQCIPACRSADDVGFVLAAVSPMGNVPDVVKGAADGDVVGGHDNRGAAEHVVGHVALVGIPRHGDAGKGLANGSEESHVGILKEVASARVGLNGAADSDALIDFDGKDVRHDPAFQLAMAVVVVLLEGVVVADDGANVAALTFHRGIIDEAAADASANAATHDAGSIIAGVLNDLDIGIRECDVLHATASAYIAEEALITGISQNLYIAHCKPAAVEMAAEGVVRRADGGVVVGRRAIVLDITIELEEIAVGVGDIGTEVNSRIHHLGQNVETVIMSSEVRIVLRAGTRPAAGYGLGWEDHSDGIVPDERIAPQVPDGTAAEAGNLKLCRGVEAAADGALEDQHIRATAHVVGQIAPVGSDSGLGVGRDNDDLAEGNAHVEGAALDVGTRRETDIVSDNRRLLLVNGLDVDVEILHIPRVVVLARSVETHDNLLEAGIGQQAAARFVPAVGLGLLAVESSYGVAVTQPFVIIVAKRNVGSIGDREGVFGIVGVFLARVVAEARQEVCVVDFAHVAVSVAAVVVRFIVHQHLEVLVTVLLLLSQEVEGHSQLHAGLGKVSLRGIGAGVITLILGIDYVTRLPEAAGSIIDGFFICEGRNLLVLEQFRRINIVLAAMGYRTVAVSQLSAIRIVEHFEAVVSARDVVDPVVINQICITGVLFMDDDRLAGLTDIKGQLARLFFKILACQRREADGAIEDGFFLYGFRTGNGEGRVTIIFD